MLQLHEMLSYLNQKGVVTFLIKSSPVLSLIFVAYFAGVSYGLVAIPAQTALQEELPEEVRGRVFGVLNMLVSLGIACDFHAVSHQARGFAFQE